MPHPTTPMPRAQNVLRVKWTSSAKKLKRRSECFAYVSKGEDRSFFAPLPIYHTLIAISHSTIPNNSTIESQRKPEIALRDPCSSAIELSLLILPPNFFLLKSESKLLSQEVVDLERVTRRSVRGNIRVKP